MQINRTQNTPSFQGWAKQNSNSKTTPKQELAIAIAQYATQNSDDKVEKCMQLAQNIANDKLFSVEFQHDPKKPTRYCIKATAIEQNGKTSSFKTGIFRNRNLLTLLQRVNKLITKENKNVQKNIDMFGLNFNLGDEDYTETIKAFRTDFNKD